MRLSDRAVRFGAALVTCAALAACGATSGTTGAGSPGTSGPTSSGASSSGSAASGTPGPSESSGPGTTPSPSSSTESPAPATKELPRGGTEVFPKYRLVGYSGAPGVPGQGRLGIGSLDARVVEMEKRAAPYKKGRQILPVMELIATTVHSAPGKDGMYRTRIDDAVIKQWLKTARKHKAILLLNIQPGRADFIDEVKAYEKWLAEPDVGLALDPEWAVEKGQIPGRVFGRTSGKELNEVTAWTSALVARHQLPEKVVVYHQLHANIVRKESALKKAEGIVLVKSIDGIGPPGAKVDTWKRIIATTPKFVHPGFKLFYQEDAAGPSRLMKPAEVMALKPRPEYVLYE